MKVLHVAETTIGGIASHLAEILPLQVERLGKGNVSLLIPANGLEHVPDVPGLNIELFEPSTNRVVSALIISRRLREIRRAIRPDIVHAHSSFGGLAARLFGGAGSTPVIYCPHAWAFTQEIPVWRKHVYAWIERLQQKRTSFIVNVSHYERSIALDFNLSDDGKLIVIENGIAKEPPASSVRAPDMDPEVVNLAFIGRSDRQKGLDLLIRAARAVDKERIMFHLVGPSPDSDLLRSVPHNMVVYGWQPRDFALALIAKADGLVMPSRWEGLPMIGIEAMRAGKPIIASDRTALPELVAHGETGILVDIDQPAALADTLRNLNRSSLQDMGRAGRRRFEERYVAEDQIAKFIDLYQESISE